MMIKIKKRKKIKLNNNKKLTKGFLFIILAYILYLTARTIFSSLHLKEKERINIVFYGKKTRFYSVDNRNKINYYISFPCDLRVNVPGGYGYYRIGALGKLVSLEKNPSLIKKTFSSELSTFIDFYFYPREVMIDFGEENKKEIIFPDLKEIFLNRSNADFFDRLYISYLFLFPDKLKYNPIFDFPLNDDGDFDAKEFAKDNLGNFYNKTYRMEDKTVQIIYSKKYGIALSLSRLVEGEGIRVVDLKQATIFDANCEILEENKNHSQTAKDLASFFHCKLKNGATGPYDVIFNLGKDEKKW